MGLTPKLNLLAQRFMQQIQDPITVDGSGVITPGNVILTVAEIENFLGDAMGKYINSIWTQAKGNRDLFIRFLPELFKSKSITFTTPVNTFYTLMPGGGLFHLYDILDSNAGAVLIEAWNAVHLSDAVAGTDPFYLGTNTRPGIIYQSPLIYLFPATLVAAANYTMNLNFIQSAVSPDDGTYLTSGGNYDIPFNIQHIADIADYATKLYRADNFEEDPQ